MRLRRREPRWRGAHMWTPAPQRVVAPSEAGVDPHELGSPAAFERLSGPPVFICGSARSGTTWTVDLFERHRKVHAICESWILCQTHGVTAILAQQYWDVAAREAWAKRVDVPFGAVQLLPYGDMVRDLADLVARWLVRGMAPEQRFLVAKEPLDVQAAAIMFPNARFVHVIRDGRDVALSMRRASESWDPTMGVGLPMEMRAEAWRRQVESIRKHRGFLGERYFEIRYEEMRADPVAATRTLFDFSEIPYDNLLLEEISATTQLSSYGDASRDSGFRGGAANLDWRSLLTRREARSFDRVAGHLLTELGYEPAATRRPSPLARLSGGRPKLAVRSADGQPGPATSHSSST
jgi:Sulfotransferase family